MGYHYIRKIINTAAHLIGWSQAESGRGRVSFVSEEIGCISLGRSEALLTVVALERVFADGSGQRNLVTRGF